MKTSTGTPSHDFRRCRWQSSLYLLANVPLEPAPCGELLEKVTAAFRIPGKEERAPGVYGETDDRRRYYSLRRKESRAS